MGEPLLKVSDLTVRYGQDGPGEEAVKGVNLSLESSMTLGVIGESGAGKSSVALAINGLLDSSSADVSGEVIFKGRDLLQLGEKELCDIRGREIGMIFQDPSASLNPTMRVIDQVAESINIHLPVDKKQARRNAIEELRKVGVKEQVLISAPYAYQLSGGLCQRIMIASALACRPKLLIADEPTSSLDVIIQAEIIELLKDRQVSEGLAILFISHDLALVSKIADYIIVMRSGVAVEQGKTQKILKNPEHAYTMELVEAWMGGEKPGKTGGARVASA